MAAVLGISAGYHDSAAALVIDGKIVAAMQEERFSRIKNDSSVPIRAAFACLGHGKILAQDLDQVVFYENPYARLERVLLSQLRWFPRTWRQFPVAIGAQLSNKLWILDQISNGLAVDRDRVVFREHHESHAASAFFPSPFQKAAILTVDAVGEESSTAIWVGEGKELRQLSNLAFPHSLGLLYAGLTAYLGFEVNEGEYKVMGLAAYGRSRFQQEFQKLIRLGKDGSFELGLEFFDQFTSTNLGFGRKMEGLLGPRRPVGRVWDLKRNEQDQRYADIAASLQAVLEDALLGLAREAKRLTGSEQLCLAGGVALNALANRRLLASGIFERIFVQPASGDAGGALGAAILGALDRGDPRADPMRSAALGLPLDLDELRMLASKMGIKFRQVEDPAEATAAFVAEGRIVGFAQGRFEWGPRALGNRSMLALPHEAATRDRINLVLKHREPFRPLAPAVTSDDSSRFFVSSPNDMTPFMTCTCDVLPEQRGRLGAVVHVDGSSRVQTVQESSNPAFYRVLRSVEKLTGQPIAVNTSLNGAGEPIVAGSQDILIFFKQHPVDVMVVENLVIERELR